MTATASITFSSSSSLHLGPSYQLPAASSSSDMSISPSIIHGSTMPTQGMDAITNITLQTQTEIELTTKRMRRSRQVRFDSKISGRRILSYTDEVRRDIYYNRQELEKMNRILMNDVHRLRQNDQTVCTRGIEHMASPEIFRGMRQEKQDAIKAVISEQKRQRMLGIDDPDRIALIATEYSAGAKTVAKFLAGR